MGAKGSETGNGIAVHTAGNVCVTGYRNSSDFPTATPIQATRNGNVIDAFLAKLNAAGSSLAYSTYLGCSSYDSGAGVAVDSSANGKGVAAVLTLRVNAYGAQTVQLVFQCGAAPGSCTATPRSTRHASFARQVSHIACGNRITSSSCGLGKSPGT